MIFGRQRDRLEETGLENADWIHLAQVAVRGGGFLLTRQWIFEFHKRRGIYLPNERLLVFKKDFLCGVNWLVFVFKLLTVEIVVSVATGRLLYFCRVHFICDQMLNFLC
jgi:hypothetical protein